MASPTQAPPRGRSCARTGPLTSGHVRPSVLQEGLLQIVLTRKIPCHIILLGTPLGADQALAHPIGRQAHLVDLHWVCTLFPVVYGYGAIPSHQGDAQPLNLLGHLQPRVHSASERSSANIWVSPV